MRVVVLVSVTRAVPCFMLMAERELHTVRLFQTATSSITDAVPYCVFRKPFLHSVRPIVFD